jgi:hypothetical protein
MKMQHLLALLNQELNPDRFMDPSLRSG